MPFVSTTIRDGPIDFHYYIATPHSPSAATVEEGLPIILLLHPEYIGMDVWVMQLGSLPLRRFNLIAVEFIRHGRTTGHISHGFTQKDGAETVRAFLDAIGVDKCFVLGMSMGTIHGLQYALSYPKRVDGLILVSPLGGEEQPETAKLRFDVADSFYAGLDAETIVDEEAVMQGNLGTLTFAFNNTIDLESIRALTARFFPQVMVQWGPGNEQVLYRMTEYVTSRRAHTIDELEQLAKSDTPVLLVRGDYDHTYPMQDTVAFYQRLVEAGVKTAAEVISGAPNFLAVTHYRELNSLTEDFVVRHWTGKPVPPAQHVVVSPIAEGMRKAGWAGQDIG